MLKVAVLVSGGGTNLQAILDAIDSGKITNTEIRVVISNNEGAYALERAKNYGTEALLLSPKSFETREEFNQKLLEALKERDIDLVVLAGPCSGPDSDLPDHSCRHSADSGHCSDHCSVRLRHFSDSPASSWHRCNSPSHPCLPDCGEAPP